MMRQCVSQSRCQRLQGHYRCSMRCLSGDGRDPDRSLRGRPKCRKSRGSIHHRIFLQTVLWHQQIRGTKALKCLLSPFHMDFRLGCRTDHRFNDMGLPLQLALSRYMGLIGVDVGEVILNTCIHIISHHSSFGVDITLSPSQLRTSPGFGRIRRTDI